MDTTLAPQVEKLIAWRIETLEGATVDAVVDSFRRGTFNPGEQLPDGVTLRAVHAFRKRSDQAKRRYVVKAFAEQARTIIAAVDAQPDPVSATSPKAETPAPISTASDAETLSQTGTVAATAPPSQSPTRSEPAEIQPLRSEALIQIGRTTGLELKDEQGDIYVTLRCFQQLIGKEPENLRRTLEARHFYIRDIEMPNARGEVRKTPAIELQHIFAIVMLADLHGMSPEQREHLFRIQHELPAWMRRFNRTAGDERLVERPQSILAALGSAASTITAKVLAVCSEGFAKLADRFDMRFDRLERLLAPSSTEPPPPKPFVNPDRVETPRFTASGNAKLIVRRPPPLRNIFEVTADVNRFMCSNYTPESIIRVAQQLGIYEREPWGMSLAGHTVKLDSGERSTWSFDMDAVDLIKDTVRKESVATNSAFSS